jgi:hypothetical protein
MGTKERAIIFPIFEECKNFTLDRFWIDCFSNFACNRFPQGVKYDPKHKNLILKIGNKAAEVIALPDDPPELFTTLMMVMKQKLGMRSTRDLKIQKEEIEHALKQRDIDLEGGFKKIKPKHLKDQLIMNYIMSLKEKYGLNASEYNTVVSMVLLGFQFKSITPDSVRYENGVIQHIDGLKFDAKKRKFTLPSYAKIPTKVEKVSTSDKFITGMHKFIKDNNLRIQKFVMPNT